MTPIFTINFRREVYQRELARTRRRLLQVGGWVAYFGVMVVIFGLYGLNCAALTVRVGQIEKQAARARAAQHGRADWTVGSTELAAAQRIQSSARYWRDKLVRLSLLVPPNAQLTSVAVNPDNLTSAADQNKLVIVGQLKIPPGEDRMRGIVQLVSSLHSDSTFSYGYQNIRLASSRVEENGSVAEFVIECR
jgi:hypothetical protein